MCSFIILVTFPNLEMAVWSGDLPSLLMAIFSGLYDKSWPLWLSWMRTTGDQEVAGLTPAGSATFFRGDLIMKYFLGSFSPFR